MVCNSFTCLLTISIISHNPIACTANFTMQKLQNYAISTHLLISFITTNTLNICATNALGMF